MKSFNVTLKSFNVTLKSLREWNFAKKTYIREPNIGGIVYLRF